MGKDKVSDCFMGYTKIIEMQADESRRTCQYQECQKVVKGKLPVKVNIGTKKEPHNKFFCSYSCAYRYVTEEAFYHGKEMARLLKISSVVAGEWGKYNGGE